MLKTETMGSRLKSLRGEQPLEAVAAYVGISRQSISKWEKDEALPKIKYLDKLAKLYGVDASYLTFGIKNPDLRDATTKRILEKLELLSPKQKTLVLENIEQFLGKRTSTKTVREDAKNGNGNSVR